MALNNPPNASSKEDNVIPNTNYSQKDSLESVVENFERSVIPNSNQIVMSIDDILAVGHSPYPSIQKDSVESVMEKFRRSVIPNFEVPDIASPLRPLFVRRFSEIEASFMKTALKRSITSNLIQKTDYDDYNKNPLLPLAQESSRSEKNIFVSQLIQSFNKELLEDGYFHPSQKIIAQGLISYHDSVSKWLFEIYSDNLKENPSLSASLLKSIGRCDFADVDPWGFMIASLGILENSVEIRGAAVDCFESWENERSLEKLKDRVNQEQVPWLRDYISQVIVDISSEQKEMELEISGS